MSKPISNQDLDYVRNARAAIQGDRVIGANLLLLTIGLCIGGLIYWASQAELDEVTKGMGKVIPSASLQTVQNLEGGIIAEILIREGDLVEEGQVLVRIDDTQSRSSFREDLSQQQSLRAALARLQAESNDLTTPEFPPEILKERPELVKRELALFDERVTDLKDQTGTLNESLLLAEEELNMTIPLVKKEILPRVDQIRLEREALTIRGELKKLTTGFRRDAMAEFNKTKTEIERLDEALSGREDRVLRTVVRSPVSGTVNHLYVKTLGGVIQPGEPIVDIVPVDDTLLVEAKIRPSDIGFLSPNQEATLKFTAYDFALYGGLKGEVEHISADTIEDPVDQQHYYNILVRNTSGDLIKDGETLPIISGMIVEVDVLTGRRTVLQYLTKPFHRMRFNALRER